MSKLPHKYCFRTQAEQESAEYQTADDYFERMGYTQEDIDDVYDQYDVNPSDYEFVEDGQEVYDGYEGIVLTSRTIRRKTDGKFFRIVDHYDSWSMEDAYVADYGDIYEVKPVLKIVYEKI